MTHAELSIRGLQKAQQANARRIAALQPSGALGKALQAMVSQAHRWAIFYTPWETGSLRASHRMDVRGSRARVYIDPHARNPRSKTRPAVYGPRLHKQGEIPGLRGGIRAFYAYAVKKQGDTIVKHGQNIIRDALEDA